MDNFHQWSDIAALSIQAFLEDLTDDESAELFDMYAKETGQLAPDIAEYIKSSKAVQKALRYACKKGVPDEVWKQFIEKAEKFPN